MSLKVGIFGGTFSPIHYGHINSIIQVKDKMDLDLIKVIPAFQSPGKQNTDQPTPEQRLKIVQLALNDYLGEITVDESELERGGVSYTVDTLKKMQEESPEDVFHLILGLDQFNTFDSWKDFKNILSMSNIIVTSRPGYFFPLSVEDFPEGLREEVSDFDGYTAILKSGKQIQFVRLQDYDMSSSEIRKRVRLNQSINKYVPLEVERYIEHSEIYSFKEGVDYDSHDLMKACKDFLVQQGGINTLAYDLRDQNQLTDFNIIASAQSKKANQTLGEKLSEHIRDELGVRPLHVEGMQESNWVVIDYGSVIIHLFYDYVRQDYKLEALWSEYPTI